jgi:hypothetical protein
MSELLPVRGIELRYLLTTHLFDHGPANIEELIEAIEVPGFRHQWASVEVRIRRTALGDGLWPGDPVGARSIRPGTDATGDRVPDRPAGEGATRQSRCVVAARRASAAPQFSSGLSQQPPRDVGEDRVADSVYSSRRPVCPARNPFRPKLTPDVRPVQGSTTLTCVTSDRHINRRRDHPAC